MKYDDYIINNNRAVKRIDREKSKRSKLFKVARFILVIGSLIAVLWSIPVEVYL